MREWWANVYWKGGRVIVGVKSDCRSSLSGSGRGAGYAVHVRLKPKGAPRRYASSWERWGWENTPETMRELKDREAFYGGHQWTPEQVARIGGTG